ncbi:HNH endonuclease [Gordonia sp. SND2]|uniref:HNH endonuclease n=1 Tax=Gordonia sp. SND2 TaxID=3388659 RepID=UPI00398AA03C
MTRRNPKRQGVIQDHAYRQAREKYRAKCAEVGAPCHICGQRISYAKDSADPFELDHFHPRSKRPELALDVANFRPAHRSCNRSRGDADVRPVLGVPSEDW